MLVGIAFCAVLAVSAVLERRQRLMECRAESERSAALAPPLSETPSERMTRLRRPFASVMLARRGVGSRFYFGFWGLVRLLQDQSDRRALGSEIDEELLRQRVWAQQFDDPGAVAIIDWFQAELAYQRDQAPHTRNRLDGAVWHLHLHEIPVPDLQVLQEEAVAAEYCDACRAFSEDPSRPNK